MTPAGPAEYHPFEFCRVYKAGGDPWAGRKPIPLTWMDEELRRELERNCREFWRAHYQTEVTLP